MPGNNPPILWTSRFVTHGLTGYSYFATILVAINACLAEQGENIMIFETIDKWILILGIVAGAVILIASRYWYQYEDKRKHSDSPVKWNHIYSIAIIATLICAIASAYLIMFFGLNLVIDKPVTDVGLAFLMAIVIGAVSAYFFDAFFPKYLADGKLAKLYADGQEAIRQKAQTEAAQKAVLDAVTKKAQSLGLFSEAKIEKLNEMCKEQGVEDPNFAIYVQLLISAPE